MLRFLKNFRKDETGSAILVATPLFTILFMLLCALVFNVAFWLQKKQELQYIADAASRAGTLAVKYEFPVLESNGKYHVYCMLDEHKSQIYAKKVLTESRKNLSGVTFVEGTQVTSEDGFVFLSPEWSSRDHKYYDKYLTQDEMYHNGDFNVYLRGTISGVWTDLLGVRDKLEVKIYSQAMASGSATK